MTDDGLTFKHTWSASPDPDQVYLEESIIRHFNLLLHCTDHTLIRLLTLL